MKVKVLLEGAVLCSIVYSLPYIGLRMGGSWKKVSLSSPPLVPDNYSLEKRDNIESYVHDVAYSIPNQHSLQFSRMLQSNSAPDSTTDYISKETIYLEPSFESTGSNDVVSV